MPTAPISHHFVAARDPAGVQNTVVGMVVEESRFTHEIVTLSTASTGNRFTLVTTLNGPDGNGEYAPTGGSITGFIVGKNEDRAMIGMNKTTGYENTSVPVDVVDYELAEVAANWGAVGGLDVLTVGLTRRPGFKGYEGDSVSSNRMDTLGSRWYVIMLELDGHLAEGVVCSFEPPAGSNIQGDGEANYSFTYSEFDTHFWALHHNQVGFNRDKSNIEKRVAYLSLMYPHQFGTVASRAVDFTGAYGLNAFNLIDENDNIVFRGTLRNRTYDGSNRYTPSTPDTHGKLVNNDSGVSYVADYSTRYSINAIQDADNPVITLGDADDPTSAVVSHTLQVGDKVAITDRFIWGGSPRVHPFAVNYELVWQYRDDVSEVTAITATGIQIERSNAAGTTPDGRSNTYSNIDNLNSTAGIMKVEPVSFLGTYVAEAEFTEFQAPAFGSYRIHIPGVGVSKAFKIDNFVWAEVAEKAMAGIYHQRCGIDIDALGYTRGTCHKPGTGGFTVRGSRVPHVFGEENTLTSSRVVAIADFLDAEFELASNPALDNAIWGGYHDAGDADRRAEHFEIPMALAWASLLMDANSRGVKFSWMPKMSTFESSSLWAETAHDSFPDILQEALWYVWFCWKNQRNDGAIYPGAETVGDIALQEPDEVDSTEWSYHSPDHVVTMFYAMAAGMCSIACREAGATTLAQELSNSAELAFSWASGLIDAAATSTGSGAKFDEYGALRTAFNDHASYTTAEFDTAESAADTTATTYRILAARVLLNATDDDATYLSYAENSASQNHGNSTYDAICMWAYLNSTNANKTQDATFQSTLLSSVKAVNETMAFDESQESSYAMPWRMAWNSGRLNTYWGSAINFQLDVAAGVYAAYEFEDAADQALYLNKIENSLSVALGCNPVNLCLVPRLGFLEWHGILHLDTEIKNLDLDERAIIIPYGLAHEPLNLVTQNDFNATWSPYYIFDADRRVSALDLYPPFERMWDTEQYIAVGEFTVQQTNLPMAVGALFMFGYKANQSGGYTSLKFGKAL